MDRALREFVWRRAESRCEYCQISQQVDELALQVEHIIPRKHGGLDREDNLALACFACNNHKGPNLTGIDPETGRTVRLFSPRQDDWHEYFQWDGAKLEGITPIGRVTVDVLAVSLPHRLELRDSLIAEGVFPPE